MIPDRLEKTLESLFSFDMAEEVERISTGIQDHLRVRLRKRGLVVGLSGGVDSSVAAALGSRAVGPDKVLGLILSETESAPSGEERAQTLANQLGIPTKVEDISPILEAIGCYRWRDAAIKKVIPEYGPNWKSKLVISGGLTDPYTHFLVVAQDPEGNETRERLRLEEYLEVLAGTNFKQRVRKTLEYAHADRLNYAVLGTPNRVEFDQGFFVKNGDGSADIKPIAHLYKSQVYMLARHLGVPEEICGATPTTDTYSLPQSQDEFYFGLPYWEMDLALLFFNQGRPISALAEALGIDETRAGLVYSSIEQKRRTTAPLHWSGLLLDSVEGPITSPG